MHLWVFFCDILGLFIGFLIFAWYNTIGGFMRIIAGQFKGRKIKPVPGTMTRPTADKVKGAIFNVLGEKVIDAKILDLFAGTGNLTLEALSRGACFGTMIEKSKAARQVILENVENMKVSESVRLLGIDSFSYLKQDNDEVFDLVFLDPPYNQGLVHKALVALAQPCRLSEHGVIVAETGSDEDIEPCYPFELRKVNQYGDSKIWYFQRLDI